MMTESTPSTSLNRIREQLDVIDQDIQQLIIKRARCMEDVFAIKAKEKDCQFYRPEREAHVLKQVMQRECGPLDPADMANIFRAIMSSCLALQQPMKVAFLGPQGTFSQLAATKHFGPALVSMDVPTIDEIFDRVEQGQAYYGVIPMENSIGGLVDDSLHRFISTHLTIVGEVCLAIHQCFLRKNPESDLPIRKIYSHQQSLLQCHSWIRHNHPDADIIALASNAEAAKRASEEEDAAVICGAHCAALYDLQILAENIEDQKQNVTRFLIIGNNPPQKSGDDRTTLLITVEDAPGALEQLINPLTQNNINITMIRSKPANQQLNAYYFFLDLDCYAEDANFLKVKTILEAGPMDIKILGSYPKAVL